MSIIKKGADKSAVCCTNRGSALISVLITFTVLSILAFVLIELVQDRLVLTVSYENLNGAIYAAQAGIEEAGVGLRNRFQEKQGEIRSSIQTYITENYDKPGYDPNEYARNLIKQLIYTEYAGNPLSSFPRSRELYKKPASGLLYSKYVITGTSYFTDSSGNDFISVISQGTFGAGSRLVNKSITANFRLNSTVEEYNKPGKGNGQMPPFSVIIHGARTANAEYSLEADCKGITFKGAGLYSPRSVYLRGGSGNMNVEIEKELITKENLIVDLGHSVQFHTADNIWVGRDLQMLDNNSELIVNDTLHTTNKLNVKGSITGRGRNDILVLPQNLVTGASVQIPQVNLPFAGDLTIFNASKNNIDVINTGLVTQSMGTLQKPVVIYNDGDIEIRNFPNDANNNTMNIYGIIYATGNIKITSAGTSGVRKVNIYGSLITGEKLKVVDQKIDVLFQYTPGVYTMIGQQYPDIIKYFGGESSGTETEQVKIVNGISIGGWSE